MEISRWGVSSENAARERWREKWTAAWMPPKRVLSHVIWAPKKITHQLGAKWMGVGRRWLSLQTILSITKWLSSHVLHTAAAAASAASGWTSHNWKQVAYHVTTLDWTLPTGATLSESYASDYRSTLIKVKLHWRDLPEICRRLQSWSLR